MDGNQIPITLNLKTIHLLVTTPRKSSTFWPQMVHNALQLLWAGGIMTERLQQQCVKIIQAFILFNPVKNTASNEAQDECPVRLEPMIWLLFTQERKFVICAQYLHRC